MYRMEKSANERSVTEFPPTDHPSAPFGQEVDAEQDTLPSDLSTLVAEAIHAEAAALSAEARRIVTFAAVAREATGRRARNESALAVCARALGTSRQTLQAYASLGARWPASALADLLKPRGRGGRRPSFTDLLRAARSPNPAHEPRAPHDPERAAHS
ncbi:MAG: hypothetical protein ACREJ3_05475 [Polyangiaceae bacterium]